MDAVLRSGLRLFGLKAGGVDFSEEQVAEGRRRGVCLVLYLSFLLLVLSCSGAWVSGGLEYTFPAAALTQRQANIIARACPGGCGAPPVGDTVRVQFSLGLTSVTQDTAAALPFTNEQTERECTFQIAPFMRYVNAASASNVTQGQGNIWAGIGPVDNKFSATLGLLVFSLLLLFGARAAVFWMEHEAPPTSTGKTPRSLLLVRVLTGLAFFFVFVAVLVFGASNTRPSFCAAFDPDADFLSLPCGYGAGFNLAVASLVFTAVTAGLSWGYLSQGVSTADVAAASGGGGSSSSAFVSGYNSEPYSGTSAGDAAAASKASSVYSASFAASSYQPIGTSSAGNGSTYQA